MMRYNSNVFPEKHPYSGTESSMVVGLRVVKRLVLALAAVCFASLTAMLAAGPAEALPQGAMQGPVNARPNRAIPGAKYLGDAECAKCHEQLADGHRSSGMARAMRPPEVADVLRQNPSLTWRSGRFTYRLDRKGDQSVYSVSDGTTTLSAPVLYAFGQGKAGQTYVYQHAGKYYESRVSFYRALRGLDVTIGHTPPPDTASLEEALGRQTPPDEIRDCFFCHSTAAVEAGKLQLDKLVPGVNCEACHGPGSEHVAAVKVPPVTDMKIFNPGHMNGDELTQEFCGKCHRSAETVLFMPNMAGINNVRFQPYRIFGSACYSDDDRISCVACHDPHQPLQLEAKFYDAKCLACHQSKPGITTIAGATEAACKVAQANCVTCHMPKVDLPGAHLKFTDHRIRIAKPGQPFPN